MWCLTYPHSWHFCFPEYVDQWVPLGQGLCVFCSLLYLSNWWNTGKQEVFNQYVLNEWITLLSLYSWGSDTKAFSSEPYSVWWAIPRQERALGAGVSGSISQRKKIALRLQWWKGLIEGGRANGLSRGQEAIWERWESMAWRPRGDWQDWQVIRIRLPGPAGNRSLCEVGKQK